MGRVAMACKNDAHWDDADEPKLCGGLIIVLHSSWAWGLAVGFNTNFVQ
jgi:hypothetical protein